jgi:hypothetical protein
MVPSRRFHGSRLELKSRALSQHQTISDQALHRHLQSHLGQTRPEHPKSRNPFASRDPYDHHPGPPSFPLRHDPSVRPRPWRRVKLLRDISSRNPHSHPARLMKKAADFTRWPKSRGQISDVHDFACGCQSTNVDVEKADEAVEAMLTGMHIIRMQISGPLCNLHACAVPQFSSGVARQMSTESFLPIFASK